jgi:4-hydroxy-tetrahydrodipicolinate synthase
MFEGCIVALATPMDGDGRVEFDRLPRLLDHLLDAGVQGVVVAGTTGESATLGTEETEALLEAIVAHCRGRLIVLAGTGSPSTAVAVARTQAAQRLGADGALVVTPYYNRPTQAGLRAHYEAVASSSDLPVVLYNVPSRTGVDLHPDTVALLADHPQVVAIKEAVPGVARTEALLHRCDGRITVLSGDDGSCGDAMLAGARGVISVVANVAPALTRELCDQALAGSVDGTARAAARLAPLLEQLGVETNPIPVKWALHEMDLAGPGIRLPLLPLSEQHRPALRACLQSLGLAPGPDE